MNYIDTKKLINQSIRHIKQEIEKEFSSSDIDTLLAQYKAKNIFELIEFLICSNSENCKNLNYKELITNLNEDLYNMSFDNQLLIKKNKELEFANDKMILEFRNIKKSVDVQNKKTSDIEIMIEKYDMILRNNNLDFVKEYNKITPNNGLNNISLDL